MTGKAFGVPLLSKSSGHVVINLPTTLAAALTGKAFLVVCTTIQNEVLAGNAVVALSAGKEITSAGRTVRMSLVIVKGTAEFLSALGTRKVMGMPILF